MEFFRVDTSTDRTFTGNPAGACLLDGDADDAWMWPVTAIGVRAVVMIAPASSDGHGFVSRCFAPAVGEYRKIRSPGPRTAHSARTGANG